MAVDLHIHTNASDGSDSVGNLLENLRDKGITTFSVTDHDTILAALAMEKIVPSDMKYIKGIEFSCYTPEGKCHILGYGYDENDNVFQNALQMGMNLRMEKMQARIDYLHDTYNVTFKENEMNWLRSQTAPGKPHLAQLLLKRNMGSTIGEAISQYINGCKDGKETKIPGEIAVKAILHAGGIPVWAHPLGGEGEPKITPKKFEKQLDLLIQYGLLGLECYYSRYHMAEIEYLKQQSQSHGLYISGGSDYHGTRKNIPLGTLNADAGTVSNEEITILTQNW